jgi:two-component system phosphate regulon sensor histidine kinase PhoR
MASMDNVVENFDSGTGINGDFQDLIFLKFIIDSLPVAVLTVNSDFKINSFNRWAEEVTGYSAKEAMGQYCGDILHGGMCNTNCPLKTVINRENPIVRIETIIKTKFGESIPVRMNSAALLDDNGKIIGGVEGFQDISQLKALEREKVNLVSMFAHDMKSSLAVIGGFVLRLLRKTDNLDEEKKEKYLNIISNESTKLEFLINDFLEFSCLQTGQLKLDFGPTSLDKELLELIETYKFRALQSGIKLEFQNEEALPIINADANRLRRVFTNLLDNAFKFSHKGCTISISTHETDKEVIFKIKDQGTGINPMDLPYIFDTFHRGSRAEKKEGFGLGLATVKAIVEGHKGRVHVESEVGHGSIFTVVLPKDGKVNQPNY